MLTGSGLNRASGRTNMPLKEPHFHGSAQNAIVTGAASGLGRAIAGIELGRRGWHCALCDVNQAGSQETLDLLRTAGAEGQVEPLDVTSPEAWQALHEKLQGSWSSLDLLVDDAGVGVGGQVGELPLADWHWIVNINLYGAIYGCHTMVPWMKTNAHGGHIVNVASMAAIASAPGDSSVQHNQSRHGCRSPRRSTAS